MKHIYLLLLVVILSGCTMGKANVRKSATAQGAPNTAVAHSEAYKHEVATQAQAFFEEHPEYINSEEMEAQLFRMYQQVLKDPKNKQLSIYQMLLVAHSQLMASR